MRNILRVPYDIRNQVEITLYHNRDNDKFLKVCTKLGVTPTFLGFSCGYYEPCWSLPDRVWTNVQKHLPKSCKVVNVEQIKLIDASTLKV